MTYGSFLLLNEYFGAFLFIEFLDSRINLQVINMV